jgi:hypothetical protein
LSRPKLIVSCSAEEKEGRKEGRLNSNEWKEKHKMEKEFSIFSFF